MRVFEQAPPAPPKPEGFWRRQFSDRPTRPQAIFDLVMGIIAPILCFYFDPVIFRNFLTTCRQPDSEITLTPAYFAIFAYTLIGLGMVALAIWLIAGPRLGRASAFFAGIFFLGAETALAFAVVMLPYSLIGLVIFIGAFGFTPFFTTFVYLRNGARAWRSARRQEPLKPRSWVFAVALTAALVIYAVPAIVQWQAWVLVPAIAIPEPLPVCSPDP